MLLPALLVAAPLTVVGQSDTGKAPAKKDAKAAQRDRGRDVFGGSGGGGPGGPERPSRMTEEQLKQMVEVIKTVQPELGQQLETVGNKNIDELREALNKVSPRLRWLAYLKTHDPQGYAVRVEEQRLQVQATDLAHRYRDAEAAAKDRLRAELRDTLEKHFEARVKVIEHDLVQLERRLERLRDDIRMQREQKNQVIEDRMAQLLTSTDAKPNFEKRPVSPR